MIAKFEFKVNQLIVTKAYRQNAPSCGPVTLF